MIRLYLNPTILKSLNFNKKDDTLEVEFKDDIDTSDFLDIPISILRKYLESIKKPVFWIKKKCITQI
ncbi:hypothetical protein [Mariniflexile sp.]|uniref:hypothetical protein n=1 Tax=Mariniflexile sp. TaxID=1979402 RepID=UPI004048269C